MCACVCVYVCVLVCVRVCMCVYFMCIFVFDVRHDSLMLRQQNEKEKFALYW